MYISECFLHIQIRQIRGRHLGDRLARIPCFLSTYLSLLPSAVPWQSCHGHMSFPPLGQQLQQRCSEARCGSGCTGGSIVGGKEPAGCDDWESWLRVGLMIGNPYKLVKV